MSNTRTPGTVGTDLLEMPVDQGTLVRWSSSAPGTTGLEELVEPGDALPSVEIPSSASLTPLAFMRRYRALAVGAATEDASVGMSLLVTYTAQLRKYFMMDWARGSEELEDYSHVTSGASRTDAWFRTNRQQIRSAAMGKGSPRDYELALEWAVRSGKVAHPCQSAIQIYCDQYLGIDCSGFVTNYLIAKGLKSDTHSTKRNTSASSYFNTRRAVNDPADIRQGDLLVWMTSTNAVRTRPGHVAVVESYTAQSTAGGSMRVVEATGAAGAKPSLLDSEYAIERIISKGRDNPVMILVVRRHGESGSRVAVMRETA